MPPCESATQMPSGIGGMRSRAASLRSRMLPTIGPFPCVMTTCRPAATSAAISRIVVRVMANCSWIVPVPSAGRMALPPSAMTSRFSMGVRYAPSRSAMRSSARWMFSREFAYDRRR